MKPPKQTAGALRPTVRRLTVIGKHYHRAHGNWTCVPDLHLRGKWLEDMGFRRGHTVDVAYDNGRLVITLSECQRFV